MRRLPVRPRGDVHEGDVQDGLGEGHVDESGDRVHEGPRRHDDDRGELQAQARTDVQTTITWKSGGGKNGPFTITQTSSPKPNKCKFETVKGKKVQDALIVSTARIATGTGKAASLKGTTFSERLCITQKTTTYLEPGSKITV